MRYIPWRSAIRLAAVVSLIVSMAFVASVAPASAQTVRRSITDLTPAQLMSLRRGVATMMSRDTAPRNSADFRRSWIYWANMHAHFGADCARPDHRQRHDRRRDLDRFQPSEDATWCACEHDTPQFLTWHRMFLWYFERVLRQASGDPSLTLPYWDYATDPRLPAAFRAQTYIDANGDRVPNPLYIAGAARGAERRHRRPRRRGHLLGQRDAGDDRTQFQQRLEATPHGAVHCAIVNNGCPNGIMGSVPVAALDPIFYLHHANIDRLYECWLRVDMNARLPTSRDRPQSQLFLRGRQRQRHPAAGPRHADHQPDPLQLFRRRRRLPAGPGSAVGRPHRPGGSGARGQAGGAGAEHRQDRAEARSDRGGASAARRGASVYGLPVVPQTATVTIEGVNAAVVPGVVYDVYLANAAGKRASIGVISFFGFGGPMTGGAHAHAAMAGRTFEFDATQAMKALGLTGTRSPKLVFEPSTGLTSSTLAAATAAIPKDAKVTFASARLTVQ